MSLVTRGQNPGMAERSLPGTPGGASRVHRKPAAHQGQGSFGTWPAGTWGTYRAKHVPKHMFLGHRVPQTRGHPCP